MTVKLEDMWTFRWRQSFWVPRSDSSLYLSSGDSKWADGRQRCVQHSVQYSTASPSPPAVRWPVCGAALLNGRQVPTRTPCTAPSWRPSGASTWRARWPSWTWSRRRSRCCARPSTRPTSSSSPRPVYRSWRTWVLLIDQLFGEVDTDRWAQNSVVLWRPKTQIISIIDTDSENVNINLPSQYVMAERDIVPRCVASRRVVHRKWRQVPTGRVTTDASPL